MESFKLAISFKNSEDESILKSYDGIIDSLNKYINNSKYDIVVEAIKDNCTDIEKLDKVTSTIPDAFVYIDFYNDTFIVPDIFVSIYSEGSNSKNFAELLKTKLTERLSNIDILNIIYCEKTYMNRMRYFPSASINISLSRIKDLSTKNMQKSIAKSIYYSLVDNFCLPQKGLDLEYITTGNLNMRSDISKKEYITTVPKGTSVKVLDKCSNVYWKVRVTVDGTVYEGYCPQLHIKPVNI